MTTLEELIPKFHEFIGERATEIFERVHHQKRYPDEVRPNLKEHYIGLANSAFRRVGKGRTLVASKIKDPKQRDIEDAIAKFDNSLLNPKKEAKESYDSWQEAIADLLAKEEFATLIYGVRETYKALMPEGTVNRTPYDKLAESILDAANVALRMIYIPVDKTGGVAQAENTQSKLSDRYDIYYSFFVKRDGNYFFTNKTGKLNEALNGPVQKRTLGREPPQDSVFINLKSVFAQENDTTVFEEHLYLEEVEEGLALNDISETNTLGIDYKRNGLLLQRDDSKTKDPLQAILVPVVVHDKSINVGALFGGYDGKKYQLKIHLERKR